jgi:hypothetical protein
MARTYFSKKYYDSPMPHSIFFYHGFAIHGTEYIHRLGGPASHGCVRLHPRAAATLYALVQRYGMSNTLIVIGDYIALERPERWGWRERGEERFINLMTERLMLAEQIERKEALEKMAQMRASDALRRMMEGGRPDAPMASDDEPAVAIGVHADDQAAIPAPVQRSIPSAARQAPPAAKLQVPVAAKPRAPVAAKPRAPVTAKPQGSARLRQPKLFQRPAPMRRQRTEGATRPQPAKRVQSRTPQRAKSQTPQRVRAPAPRHRQVAPPPSRRPAQAEQWRRKVSSSPPTRKPDRRAAVIRR